MPTASTEPDMETLGSKEIVVDAKYPISPKELYELMFDSDWFTKFLLENQKVWDLEFQDWKKREKEPSLLERDFQYKRANSGIGPKEVLCLAHVENQHQDDDDYIETQTTTRTPDVPYGGSFHVLSTTKIAWADNKDDGSILNVKLDIEWTGWCPFKGTIEGKVTEGQKQYSADIDAAVREELAKAKLGKNQTGSSGHQVGMVPESSNLGANAKGVLLPESWLERQSLPTQRASRCWTVSFLVLLSILLTLLVVRLCA